MLLEIEAVAESALDVAMLSRETACQIAPPHPAIEATSSSRGVDG